MQEVVNVFTHLIMNMKKQTAEKIKEMQFLVIFIFHKRH